MKLKNTITKNIAGIGCATLIILPFLLIGIGTLYISLSNLYLQIKTNDWIPVKAEIEDIKLISTPHDDGGGYSYETKCTYTYIYENKNYTNNIISIGYGNNNTENHQELYKILKYTNVLTAYVNPCKPDDSILAKGTNSTTTSLLIFSVLWNGFILVFYRANKYKKITPIFILIFISGLVIIISGISHTNFKERITVIDKKSEKEIKQIEEELFDKIIEEYE
ncbi:DUF3592 domain-containing protein [Tenacibaculum maritimum]|uniref:DUF3592 domain-containing protein n=1 Tax=Tenacibaculum maritimum TaxID=107401 RepID=UPI0012E5C244|nr:DUF3592 domain-containing protein [Tenacibaculum maritimum]CAA0227924.1 conserved membrane hypothetical protein [Tenacibaculum maritimum]